MFSQIAIEVGQRRHYLRFCGFFLDFVRSTKVRHGILFIHKGEALLLPATTQRLIECDESEQFIALRLSQIELGGECVRFVSQYFEIIRGSGIEADLRKLLLGALPIALGYGADGSSRRPLGLVVVDGHVAIHNFVRDTRDLSFPAGVPGKGAGSHSFLQVRQKTTAGAEPRFGSCFLRKVEIDHVEDGW